MWILPKQLHTSDFVPDTAALSLDSTELSEICARSLFVRSKASPARTWSQKWRRDSWTALLSGRILNPSHGQSFVTAWTSSLGAIPANPSAQPESDSAQTTLATSGHTSPDQYELFDLDYASLKMSKATSPLDSERSLESWNKLVTRRRGEYSARVKSGRLTSASGSSSWPTSNARDWKDSITGTHPPSRPNLSEQTLGQAVSVAHGQAAPAIPSTDGSRQESWPTITAHTPDMESSGPNGNSGTYLAGAVKQWGTPTARDHKSGRGNEEREYKELTPMVERTQTGKLNPRWVETLMGLPVGWVMPSCASPVTIALTSCGSSATGSSQLQQSELLEF